MNSPFPKARQWSLGTRAVQQIAPVHTHVWGHAVYWLACATMLVAIHSGHRLNSDEGVVLNGAWNVLNGQKPYTDFFEFIAPGSFYLVAALWRIVGPDFMAAKLLGVSAILGSAVAIYHLARLLLETAGVKAPAASLLFGPSVFALYSSYWPTINHNTFHLVFVLWSAYFLARHLDRGRTWDAALAGGLAGGAVLFLQHRGFLLVATSVVALLLLSSARPPGRRPALVISYVIGVAAVLTPVLFAWPPSLLLEDLVLFPAQHYMEVNRSPPHLLVLATFLAGLMFWGCRRVKGGAVRYLMLLQAALLIASVQRPDFIHLTMNLFPLLALMPLHGALAARRSRHAQRIQVALVTALVVLLCQSPLWSPPWFRAPFQARLTHPMFDFIRSNCTATRHLYAGPFLPGLYYETRTLNPVRYSLLIEKFNTPQQFSEAVRTLRSDPPQCAVTAYVLVEKFRHTQKNDVDRFLSAHYGKGFDQGGLTVWVLRD